MPGLLHLTGAHALVTGASGGLGAHFARVLVTAGAKVTLAARRQAALAEVVDAIRATGGEAHAEVADIADAADVERALDGAEGWGGPVTVVVNNAGVAQTSPALQVEEADWDRVVATNLKGSWLVARSAARRMIAHGEPGSIVNVASILGLRVAGGVTPYAASKAALIQMTKALALEWARHRIRVNALAPGYIETDINREFFASDAGRELVRRIPQRRLGHATELDGALLLLASGAGSYITGSVIPVDGGHLVSSL